MDKRTNANHIKIYCYIAHRCNRSNGVGGNNMEKMDVSTIALAATGMALSGIYSPEMLEKSRALDEIIFKAYQVYGEDMAQVVKQRFAELPYGFWGCLNIVSEEISERTLHLYVKDVASILKKYTTDINMNSWSGIFGTSIIYTSSSAIKRESYNLAHPYNHIHGIQNLKDSERAIIVTQERLVHPAIAIQDYTMQLGVFIEKTQDMFWLLDRRVKEWNSYVA